VFRNMTEEEIRQMISGHDDSKKTPDIKKAQFAQLAEKRSPDTSREPLSFLQEIELELEVELGETQLSLQEVLLLKEGSLITLNKMAGDTVDLKVNNQWLAAGEVLVINEVFGLRISSFNRAKAELTRGVR